MDYINSIHPVKSGSIIFGIKVPHQLTTRDHEQSIYYDLQASLAHEIYKALQDGRKLTVHMSNVSSEEYSDDEFLYYIQAIILIFDYMEADVGDYVEPPPIPSEEGLHTTDDGMVFKKDNIGWQRTE